MRLNSPEHDSSDKPLANAMIVENPRGPDINSLPDSRVLRMLNVMQRDEYRLPPVTDNFSFY